MLIPFSDTLLVHNWSKGKAYLVMFTVFILPMDIGFRTLFVSGSLRCFIAGITIKATRSIAYMH